LSLENKCSCDGTGFVEYENGRFGPCQCLLKKLSDQKVREFIESSRLDKRWIGKTLDNFKSLPGTEIALRECRKFVTYFKEGMFDQWLYIFGKNGNGKTHLAAGILNELKEVPGGVFVNCAELLEDIRRSYNTNKTSEIMKICQSTPLLILDDLGAERIKEYEMEGKSWTAGQFYLILNKRYGNLLATVMTSNYDFDQLEKRLGIRIVSRMVEMCWIVENKAESYREIKKR
jgi:DNA replication protein DnaC